MIKLVSAHSFLPKSENSFVRFSSTISMLPFTDSIASGSSIDLNSHFLTNHTSIQEVKRYR